MQSHNQNDRSQRKGAPPKVIIDLSKLTDQEVTVHLAGGRQVRGVLKGWDPLLNLVLDEAVEEVRGKFTRADPNLTCVFQVFYSGIQEYV